MASLATWLIRLGNAGAVRNAAAVRAERKAAEARVEALARRFERDQALAVRRVA